MSSRKRHRSTNDENHIPSPKRQRTSNTQKSQISQFAGNGSKTKVFRDLMQQCQIRLRTTKTKPHELDSPKGIYAYIQRVLRRDEEKQSDFIDSFIAFMESSNDQRLTQALMPTIPKRNNRTQFISEAWRNMSQITEGDIQSIATITQPSLIRILLNVDCLQNKIIQFLIDKATEHINHEGKQDLVIQILEQFKFLDHIVGDAQEFVKELFGLLEFGVPMNTQISIIDLFDEIINDAQHEYVATKLHEKLQINTNLTRPIIECLSQLKISVELKRKTEVFLLDSLETSDEKDLDIIIRYLLRTVSADSAKEVLHSMRMSIPFNTVHNKSIFAALRQCIGIQKHVLTAIMDGIRETDKRSHDKALKGIDLWLLFILYNEGGVSPTKIEQLISKKIENGMMNTKYIIDSIGIESKDCAVKAVNVEILIESDIIYLAQTMLESKSLIVSDIGKLLYKILYKAMNSDKRYRKYQQTLISSVTQQIGSGTSTEVNNSLSVLDELCVNNMQSIKTYQRPIMNILDYVEGFSNKQVRLLYKIISLLGVNIDSDNQLQLSNEVTVAIAKQLSHSGFIHQQKAGIIGSIQLIYAISTRFAYQTENGINEAKILFKKVVGVAGKNMQMFAIMCDELSLMIEHSRNYKRSTVAWNEYKCEESNYNNTNAMDSSDSDNEGENDTKMNEQTNDKFYPIHKEILQEFDRSVCAMVSDPWAINAQCNGANMSSQNAEYSKYDLRPQLWLNLSGRKGPNFRQRRDSNGMDSEATAYTTDNDTEQSGEDFIVLSITPVLVRQRMTQLMWVFSPLFRLFGIVTHALRGELARIDSFLTAPLVMFEDSDLKEELCIDKGRVTRQIMGDSIFSACNCVIELLNMFCSEYIESVRSEMGEYGHNQNMSVSNRSRMGRIERKLCHRLDNLVVLKLKLETFMRSNINKQFLPSFIPSQNMEQTWLNSPPWKRKMLSVKKTKKKVSKDKDTETDKVDSDDLMIDTEDDSDGRDSNAKNKNKKAKTKKVKPKKQLSHKKSRKNKKKKSKKVKSKKKKKSKPKSKKPKASDLRSPLTKIEPYLRDMNLSVAVLLQFEILDRNYFNRAIKRMTAVSYPKMKHFDTMISLRGFEALLHDFCQKTIEIINNQSARKGFASKEINENIIDYTPVTLLERYGFIFGYISKQMQELMTFQNNIYEVLEDETEDQNKVAHYRTLTPIIQNCFKDFVKCLAKLFRYRPFELESNRNTFDNQLLRHLYRSHVHSNNNNGDEDINDLNFTKLSINLMQKLEKICDYIQDIDVCVELVSLMEYILKYSRFEKNSRIDFKVKVQSVCKKMLLGTIGEGFLGQTFKASNIGQIVSIYFKNCKNERQTMGEIAKLYTGINKIEDTKVNEWHQLLNKKTMSHFLKPMLDSTVTLYASYAIKDDVKLQFHTKCVAHFIELMRIITKMNKPQTMSLIINYGTLLFTKIIAKMSKFQDSHLSKHVLAHLDQIQIVLKGLHREIHRIQRTLINDEKKTVRKQWMKVADKTPKLKKLLDQWLLKTKTFMHAAGMGETMEIGALKSEKGQIGLRQSKRRSRANREQKEEESEDEQEEEEEEEEGSEESEEEGSESDESEENSSESESD